MCPSDNKRHYGLNLSSLPCCYTILSNLPKETSESGRKELCCLRHPRKKIKFFCETHSEFLCTTCVIQHTGPGHNVANFTITSKLADDTMMVDDQVKANLGDTLYKYEVQLSEATKLKSQFDCADKKLIEYLSCQLNKLNMSYDSAIKIINERRKHFTEVLKRSLTEEKRRLDFDKSRVCKRIEKLTESMKPLKECSANVERVHYEELYKTLLQKNADLKQIVEGSLKGVPDVIYACFKDSIKLSDLGSIQYLKGADTRDFAPGRDRAASPPKDCSDRREKCNSINKCSNRASDLNTSKTHRKEKGSASKAGAETVPQNSVPPQPVKPKEDSKKINESLYPQTSRGKNNYFAISSYHPPARSKATPSKHKNPKVSTNSSHTSTKPPDSLTPKPAKETSETMIKYGTSNLTGISRFTRKDCCGGEKENLKNSELELGGYGKVQTTRETPGEKIVPPTTGRGPSESGSNNPSAAPTGINPVIEEPIGENANDKSMVKVMDDDEPVGEKAAAPVKRNECAEKTAADQKDFNIFEANILNAEYTNALNNTSVVTHRLEGLKSSQRSTSTSHRQSHTHMAKYGGAGKTILQPKQVQPQVLKIVARDKASAPIPAQVLPKKKHVSVSEFVP